MLHWFGALEYWLNSTGVVAEAPEIASPVIVVQ
jgi:hypothetical protein